MGRTRDKIEKLRKKIAAKPKKFTVYFRNPDGTSTPLILDADEAPV